MEIVMSLVFASVLLVFMIYPAIKIVEFLEIKMTITDKMYNILTVSITILLALIVGAGLYFI
ncbi:putative membrane protein [Arcobacter acticola]|jgi:hypothetical protein|uniref:Putative membrane protein n=1 Tax=Arcobacter acticola TaxID=1849015 RepID=A0A6M8E939_9BACT|nr:hypothetical protein [Arcobacter acticola]MBP9616248.1 hypothetical protein [Aliarcobacter sp.]QKE27763.1 putative membrane protein [Arcobacter acticola]